MSKRTRDLAFRGDTHPREVANIRAQLAAANALLAERERSGRELVACLETAVAIQSELSKPNGPCVEPLCNRFGCIGQHIDMWRAAIAKATGRTQ